MSPQEVMQVWSNALRQERQWNKSKAGRAARRQARFDASVVIQAIEDVWVVRSRGAPADWFPWPITDAPGGDGTLTPNGWLPQGALGFLGYSVGRNGLHEDLRRAILARAFSGPIPPVFPTFYLDEWGAPGSTIRLRKMAESIASFTRSAKRRDPGLLSEAIADWERDLQFLYKAYYVGEFGFGWPSTDLF